MIRLHQILTISAAAVRSDIRQLDVSEIDLLYIEILFSRSPSRCLVHPESFCPISENLLAGASGVDPAKGSLLSDVFAIDGDSTPNFEGVNIILWKLTDWFEETILNTCQPNVRICHTIVFSPYIHHTYSPPIRLQQGRWNQKRQNLTKTS